MQFAKVDRPRAIEEYSTLIQNPRFEEVLVEEPSAIRAYHHVATSLMDGGKIDQALEVAQRCLVHVGRSRALTVESLEARREPVTPLSIEPRGETYYLLARIHQAASRAPTTPPEDRGAHFDRSIEYLKRAFAENPDRFRDGWFLRDKMFHPTRDAISRRLALPDVAFDEPPAR